jgi:hypothetical protein
VGQQYLGIRNTTQVVITCVINSQVSSAVGWQSTELEASTLRWLCNKQPKGSSAVDQQLGIRNTTLRRLCLYNKQSVVVQWVNNAQN